MVLETCFHYYNNTKKITTAELVHFILRRGYSVSDLELFVFSCVFRDTDETKPPKEKQDGKEKSSGSRRGNRYHPYKDKHAAEKKGAHRNRVFISNIPYDMKWQAIKDLMREKGNVPVEWELFCPIL